MLRGSEWMRIAVVGGLGQLGSDLMLLLGERAVSLGHDQIELTSASSISTALDPLQPTHVVNCAAYNLVDRAEDEPDVAFQVNALGPRNLAKWCAARGVVLVHVSTDYVFGLDEGGRQPRSEAAAPGPVSAYGASKLAGEYFVRSHCERHVIVRTCGLYGRRAARGKGNFVETMLRLGRERPELRVVADQRCTPTSTSDLANALCRLMDTGATGLFHATNTGDCSWFEFATEIFRQAQLPARLVPIPASEYGAKARRPDFSVLDTGRLTRTIGTSMPSWQEALSRYLSDRDRP